MKVSFKGGEMLAPVPVVMVSLGQGDEQNIITVAWTGIINSDPPMTYISVRKSRYSHDILLKEKEFVINLTSEQTTKATDWCGVKSGRDFDKFKETGLTAEKAQKVSCPLIAEAAISLECKVKQVIELPSHDMFMAEIVAVDVDESIIDETGKIDYSKANLTAYVHGEYYGLKKQPLGRFGYSIMKPKTQKRVSKEAHAKRVAANKSKRNASKQAANTNAKSNAGKSAAKSNSNKPAAKSTAKTNSNKPATKKPTSSKSGYKK